MEKTCGIFLIDGHNRLLIIHPTRSKRNIFSIPKGGIEICDINNFDTACRELLEETNVDILKCAIDYIIPIEPVPYLSKRKTLVSFIVKIKDILNVGQLSCPSMTSDKKGHTFPENDDFFLVKIKNIRPGNRFYEGLHESQIRAFFSNKYYKG